MSKLSKWLPAAATPVLLALAVPAQTATVNFSNQPLVGVGKTYAPNVLLALSVEYPTAKSAYVSTEFLTEAMLKNRFLGYFDNAKCYTYKENGKAGYFVPSSIAVTSDKGFVGMCNNGRDDEYSGNALNFLTMTAIDVFRQTMTGGNRAIVKEPDRTLITEAGRLQEYKEGDTESLTFLRRAYIMGGKNTFTKKIHKNAVRSQLNRLVPAKYWTTGAKKYTTGSFAVQSQKNGFGIEIITSTDDGLKNNVNTYPLNVVINVCNNKLGDNFLEDNCVAYGDHYKPEGLLQSYASDGMRVGVLGYPIDSDRGSPGGVLRGRMKYLNRKNTVFPYSISGVRQGAVNLEAEWDPKTGIFAINPDETDTTTYRVSNSGVINYTNKFGDSKGYKTYDHGAELYYTALRYLRFGAWKDGAEQAVWANKAPYVGKQNPSAAKADNFPLIYNWDDPMEGVDGGKAEALCRKNTIIYIGDTNTHYDNDLPNFQNQPGFPSSMRTTQTIDTTEYADNIPTADYLKALLSFQNSGKKWFDTYGSTRSGGGMAGLAYWARVNNIRPDIKGDSDIDVNVNSFFIDVVEGNDFKGGSDATTRNIYYLAAKFGGFDNTSTASKSTYRDSGVNLTIPNPVNSRSSWTNDAAGATSISDFLGGVPKNYAPANDPDKMSTALSNAFTSAGASTSNSQTGATYASSGSVTDLSTGKAVVLQTAYDSTKWTGDVIAGTASSAGSGSVAVTEIWRAAALMDKAYHSTDKAKWAARNVYAMGINGISRFDLNNLSSFASQITAGGTGVNAEQIISYILGDSTYEGDGSSAAAPYRKRDSILGTVVNSKVAGIVAPSSLTVGSGRCTFADASATSRAPYYAFASNEGLFHLLDQNGKEVLAYLPSTALSGLYQYALPAYQHFYLNDGSPAVANLCSGTTAKTYLAGSAGRGGRSVYAMDVTNLNTPGESNILWEFNGETDSAMGNATGKVVLSQDYNGNPIAIFSSGYWNSSDDSSSSGSASNRGYLYIVKLDKSGSWSGGGSGDVLANGINYLRIPLGNSGVGSPFVYDSDNDGVADRIYVGDQDGKVWRVDQTAEGNKKGSWAVAYENKPMFVPDTAAAKPIMAAPYVQTIRNVTYVVAGTGLYFNASNLSADTQNYAYGFFDTGTDGSITSADLLEQEIVSTPVATNKSTSTSYYKITDHALSTKNRGWRLKLIPGQTIPSVASIRQKKLAEFTAVRLLQSDNACTQSGATALISVDVTNGGLYSQVIFDTNGDGLFNGSDAAAGMMEIAGTVNPGAAVGQNSEGAAFDTPGSDGFGSNPVNPLLTNAYVRRLSWRQLFD